MRVTLLALFSLIILTSVWMLDAYGDDDPPKRVRDLAGSIISRAEIMLTWTVPDSGDSPITHYKIYVTTDLGTSYERTISINTNDNKASYLHTGLTEGREYIYKVSAVSDLGEGGSSSEISVTPDASAASGGASGQAPSSGVPSTPRLFNADKINNTANGLIWLQPEHNADSIISYTIQRKNNTHPKFESLANIPNTQYEDVNLTGGTTYTYRVSATNSEGAGAYSEEKSVTMPVVDVLGQQRPNSPEGVDAFPLSKNGILVIWQAPTSDDPPVSGYKIEAKKRGTSDYETILDGGRGTTEYLHVLSESSGTYEYRILAFNDNGESSKVQISAVEAKGTKTPTYLVATPVSSSSILLSWHEPSDTATLSITGYAIDLVLSSGETDRIQETSNTNTEFTVTNLEAGREYTYEVRAKLGEFSFTDPSNEASATPTSSSQRTSAATWPGQPTNLKATPSLNHIDLQWTAPSDNGGSAITGYRLEHKLVFQAGYTVLPNASSTQTTFRHTDLKPDTQYMYRVSAINTAGQSLPSEPITVTTEAEATTTPDPTTPTRVTTPRPPQNVTAEQVSSGNIMISWTAPSDNGGSAVTGYTLEVRKNNGQYSVLYEGTETSYTHTGFDAGATYVYRAAAENERGQGPTSMTVAVTVPPQAPPPVSEPEPVPEPPPVSEPPSIPEPPLVPEPPPVSEPEPVPEPPPVPQPEPEPDTIDPTKVIPNFPDPSRDTQHYLDRYANEPEYREWFDRNSKGFTIYEVLDVPTPPPDPRTLIPGFPDPARDPQYYVDRYNNEPKYREWFDRNFANYTIYEVVGATPPAQATVCGPGTTMVDGKCVAEDSAPRGGGCLIATAAFGSELAPQIQMLREIRDDKLLSTKAGSSFMAGFNTVYYIFSPAVADWQRDSPEFKELVKMSITPMIASLNIMTLADSESDVLMLGISVIMLNVAMYVATPAFVALRIKRLL